ncbi:MAG: lactate racemase domain-containing protein [Spirochaetota bacterium]
MSLRVAPVRQLLSSERVENIAAAVRRGLQALPLDERVKAGMRIAVAVGSRGISSMVIIVRTLVEELVALGSTPFLVPAMGSHGGGTAEGQRALLESYGLQSASLGVPIQSSLETVKIGETPEEMPVYLDAHAAAADGIIAINRIKEHTAFKGHWESGLFKILSVGLGKARGATDIHNRGIHEAMPAAARVILANMPVIAGIGIVENGYHEPARIIVLPAERIEAEEPALLDLSRKLTPKIPLEPLDLLLVQEMGKDISGTGMDLNVIGMWRRSGGPVVPLINTIAVLDLTEKSHGNATGVGHADLITQRLRDKIDQSSTYTNCLTSHNLPGGKIPITLATDHQVIETGLAGVAHERARVAIIRNTLDLELLWASEALLSEIAASPILERVGPLRGLEFDEAGTLILPEVDGL